MVPNHINKASLPPNLYHPLSAIFSNNQIWWIVPYYELHHLHYTNWRLKILHLATTFLRLVAKRRPENFFNFEPCPSNQNSSSDRAPLLFVLEESLCYYHNVLTAYRWSSSAVGDDLACNVWLWVAQRLLIKNTSWSKISRQNNLIGTTQFSRHCFGFQSQGFSLLVGYR